MDNIVVSPFIYILVIIAFILLVVLNIALELRINSLKRILQIWLVLGHKNEYLWYSLFGYSREQMIELFKREYPDIDLPSDK